MFRGRQRQVGEGIRTPDLNIGTLERLAVVHLHDLDVHVEEDSILGIYNILADELASNVFHQLALLGGT